MKIRFFLAVLLALSFAASSVSRDTAAASEIGAVATPSAPIQAAAGLSMLHVVRADGSLWSTGSNSAGQLADGGQPSRTALVQIATGVARIDAGFEHVLVTKTDGSLWTAGDNQLGQLGDGTTVSRGSLTQVANGVSMAAGGYRHSLFCKTDGTLWAVGLNSAGQLGDGSLVNRSSQIKIAENVTGVAAGFSNSFFVRSDGSLWAMGSNGGSFGNGTTAGTAIPVQIATDVTAVSSFYHALILKRDGTLWATGRNDRGQLGDGTVEGKVSSVQIASGVVAVAAGALHSVWLKEDGTAWTVGANDRGQLADGTMVDRRTPAQISSNVVGISAGSFTTYLVMRNGTLLAFGANELGQLGDGATVDRTSPAPVASGGESIPLGVNYVWATNSATADRITVSWNRAVGATHHSVWRKIGITRSSIVPTDAILVGSHVVGSYFEDLDSVPGASYTYWVRSENAWGTALTAAYAVGMQGAAPVAPVWQKQPMDQQADSNATVSFYAGALGGLPRSYRWQIRLRDTDNWSDIVDGVSSGTDSSQLALTVTLARHGAHVRCIATNPYGEAMSSVARLTLKSAIAIQSTSPARQMFLPSQTVTLAASASSAIGATLSYQWTRNNRPIGGATGSTLVLSNPGWGDAGAYTLEVRDSYGGTARLTRFLLLDPGPTQVRAWGSNSEGQGEVPIALGDAIAVAAGRAHTIALKLDGTVAVWGDISHGQATSLSFEHDIVAIGACGNHSIMLRSDGLVQQIGDQNISLNAEGGIAIATGGQSGQMLVLLNDGRVESINLNYLVDPRPPTGLANVVAIAAGAKHSVAVKLDGTVVTWGNAPAGVITVPDGLAGVHSVAAGELHTLALKADGKVVAWGDNSAGQCDVPAGLSDVVAIAAGAYHSLARRSDGTIVTWGRNSSGETAVPAGIGSVLMLAGGGSHSVAVRSSTGDQAPVVTVNPTSLQRNEGETATFVVTAIGALPLRYQWRRNGVPISGATSASYAVSSTTTTAGLYDVVVTNHVGSTISAAAVLAVVGSSTPPSVTSRPAARVQGNPGNALALSVSAVSNNLPLAYQWKKNNRPIEGATSATLTLANFSNADAGAYTLVITDSAGLKTLVTTFVLPRYLRTQVRGWNVATWSSLYPLPKDTDAIDVASGLLLKADGQVSPWGTFGPFNTVPANATDAVSLSAGSYTAVALRSDGSPVVWGTVVSDAVSSVPSTAKGLIAACAGAGHVLAVKDDGKVIAWGRNVDGESAVPAGLTEVVQVAAGDYHSLALRVDGTVVAWGRNSSGQANVPVGLTGVVQVAASTDVSYALKSDGTIVAWGANDYRELLNVPLAAMPAVQIFARGDNAAAVKADGTLVQWGANTYGQLSTQLGGLAPVLRFMPGDIPIVLRDASGDVAPIIATQPTGARVAIGDSLTLTVSASGPAPLTYQWRRDGAVLAGQTSATLMLFNLQTTDSGAYDVEITNHVGSVTSSSASVLVEAPPAIINSTPHLLSAAVGAPLELSVAASSVNLPLTYQWRKDNRIISGARSPVLTLASFTLADAGTYSLEITDSTGLRTWFIAFVRPELARTQVLAWDETLASVITLSNEPVAHFDSTGVAVRRDGTVFALVPGTSHPAIGRTGIAKVAGQLLLKADGTVESVSQTGGAIHFDLPAGLSGVVDLQVSGSYAVALKADGTIVAWGNNDYGQLNFGSLPTDVVQFSFGGNWTTYFLKGDGNYVALAGHGAVAPSGNLDVTQLTSIAAGADFVVATKSDRSVITWGNIAEQSVSFAGSVSSAAEIATFGTSTLLRTATGAVRAWGRGRDTGQAFAFTPVADKAVAIFRTPSRSIAVRDASADTVPTIVTPPASSAKLPGDSVTFSVTATGAGPFTYQWRKNGAAITGATTPSLTLGNLSSSDVAGYDVVVTNHIGSTASSVASLTLGVRPTVVVQTQRRQVALPGGNVSFSVSASGAGPLAYQWFHNGRPLPGETAATLALAGVTARASGYYYVDVNDDAGTERSAAMFLQVAPAETRVIGFGFGYEGANQAPASLTDAVAIAAGYYHSLAIRRDGTVVSWGSSAYGQSNVPAGLTDVVAIAGGVSHSLALKSDGTVVAWGGNTFNQLNVPAQATDIVAIATGHENCIAIKRDGSVVMWGAYLFAGSGHDFPPETRAVGQPFAGYNYAGVIDVAGGVSLRGFNDYGQKDIPSNVGTIREAASRSSHTVALRTDGTVVGWGYNLSGQTVSPAGLTNVVAVAAGDSHSLALRADGTLIRWGDGATTGPAEAVNVFAIASGAQFSLALRGMAAESLLITGHPSDRYVFAPNVARFTVGAAGTGEITYRWQRVAVGGAWTDLSDGGAYAGTTSATLLVGPTSLPMQGDRFRCVVSNGTQTVTSESAYLGVMPSTESAPGLSLSVTGPQRVGGAVTIYFSVGDSNNDLEFATLWIRTPLRGWLALRPDGSTVASQAFSADNAFTTTPGLRTPTFAFTPTDGPGVYTIAAAAIDASGQRTDRSLELVIEDNRAPTASLYLSGQRTMGETLTATLNVDDPDGNFEFANLRVQTPKRGWIIVRNDNTTVVSTAPDSTANSVQNIGSTTRRVSFTPTDGAGDYTFTLTAVDALGARFDTPPQTIAVRKVTQSIAFDALSSREFNPTPTRVIATSSSGLPVTLAVVSGPATLDGDQLTLTGLGTVVLRATQAGDDTYEEAPSILRSFQVLDRFDAWRANSFTEFELLDESLSGPDADPDHDGVPNLVEYALGSDPKNSANSGGPVVEASSDHWSFTFTRPADRVDVSYTVECSTNLTSWSSDGVTLTRVATVDGIETWRATYPSVAAPSCFFRLVVTR